MINSETLCENLRELASRDLQEEIWLGNRENRMSSFEEAVCGVFDDAGLTRAIDTGFLQRTFSQEVHQRATELSDLVTLLPDKASPQDIIDHPRMNKVRSVASELLALFTRSLEE